MKENPENNKFSFDKLPLGFIVMTIGVLWFGYTVLKMEKK